MKITIPLEITVKFNPYKTKTKNKQVIKEITTWIVNDFKNMWIPILNDTEAVAVKKVKVGEIE